MKSDAIPNNPLAAGSPRAEIKTPAHPVSTELLFRGAKEIVIRHQGDDYRLRITRNDKLILTK